MLVKYAALQVNITYKAFIQSTSLSSDWIKHG